MEIGVVGGEEDGVAADIDDKLYTAPGDYEATVDALGGGEKGRYLLAATFGNVHGVYKPGNVVLRPDVLKKGQEVAGREARAARGLEAVRPGLPRRVGLAARGDPRGPRLRRGQDERRHRHPVRLHPADRRAHVRNYDGVLKIDGEVGNKKVYDPRSYLKAAEQGMADRVTQRLREPPLDRAVARQVAARPLAAGPREGNPRSRRSTGDPSRGPAARAVG